jgi:hypothetical protein
MGELAVPAGEGRPARRDSLAPPPVTVWVVVARPQREAGTESSEVVAAFSRLAPALAWMARSEISLLLVPVVLDAEL